MRTETQGNEPRAEIQGRVITLPVLTESSVLRNVLFASLYLAQGLPPGLMTVAFPAWLAEGNIGTVEIGGFIAITTLAWGFKVVLGPLMDRFSYLPMGRRRPWVVGAQLGLLLSFTLLSFVSDPAQNLHHVVAIGFVVSLFVAIQDVAVDGMAIDIIPVKERARANGFMWGSKTLGMAVGASGGGIILSTQGFKAAILLVVGIIGMISLFPLLLRERPGERFLPWTRGEASDVSMGLQLHDWRSILRGLLRVFVMPSSIAAALVAFVFLLNVGLLRTMLPVLCVQELGWNHTYFSHLFAAAGIISCIVGMLLSATIIDRLGEIRTFVVLALLLVTVEITAGFMMTLWATRMVFVSFVIVVSIINFSGTVTLLAMMMNICWRRVAATQFALYMAIGNIGFSAGAALTGPLDALFGYTHMFFAMAFCALLLLVLLRYTNLKAHRKQLAALDVEEPPSRTQTNTP
jgi:PAT family beta-lactamase induction signal transducer AmpG